MHKQDLALNNLQGLVCHKTKQNNQPTKYLYLNGSLISFNFKKRINDKKNLVKINYAEQCFTEYILENTTDKKSLRAVAKKTTKTNVKEILMKNGRQCFI